MNKDMLVSMAFSTEKDAKDRLASVVAELQAVAICTSKEDLRDKSIINHHIEKAQDLISDGYIYGTIDMTVAQLETACNCLVEAKSLLMSAMLRIHSIKSRQAKTLSKLAHDYDRAEEEATAQADVDAKVKAFITHIESIMPITTEILAKLARNDRNAEWDVAYQRVLDGDMFIIEIHDAMEVYFEREREESCDPEYWANEESMLVTARTEYTDECKAFDNRTYA